LFEKTTNKERVKNDKNHQHEVILFVVEVSATIKHKIPHKSDKAKRNLQCSAFPVSLFS